MRSVKASSKQRSKNNVILNKAYAKPLIFSVAMGLIFGLMTYAIKNGINDLANQKIDQFTTAFSSNIGFTINDIWVEGRENTPLSDLQAVVNLELDQPIFQADPDYLRQRVEALPWVERASIERRLPDIMHIKLYEHRPIAIWQSNQTFSLINVEGNVILTGGDDIEVFAHLPLVVGNGAPKHAEKILNIINSEPSLKSKVKAVVRVSNRRWDVVLKDKTTIRLPEHLPEAAWARLATYSQEYKLFEHDFQHVDMRLEDKILIKFDDLETIRKPLLGQNT